MRSRWRKLAPLLAPVGLVPLFACLAPPVESPKTTVTQETSVRVEQSVKNKVDLLFMVDNSPSMLAMQQELQNRFGDFLQAFSDLTAQGIYADMHIAHSLGDTLLLAQMAGIGVCIDVVSCWPEAGLKETIARAMPRTWLVQLGDYVAGDRAMPYRAVPGDGDIPLERILGWLLEAGYNGVFDLELIGPRIDAEGHLEATRRAAIVVSEMLRSLGA